MNYCVALKLHTMAVQGQLAQMRLCWDALGKVALSAADKDRLLDVAADGITAMQILWEHGIRFSFTRVLSEEEAKGRPGWNPARHGRAAS